MTGTASENAKQRYAASLMNAFGPPKLVLARGEGAYVWDVDGNRYLDLLGGIAVNALGHAHPALVGAVNDQLSTLGHVSNFFATEPQIALAERLLEMVSSRLGGVAGKGLGGVAGDGLGGVAGDGRVFFANSGTEANEAAFKLTRRTGRTHLVAMEGSFHGRSMGALALTAKAAYREPFEPLPGYVDFVPYGDADALAAAVTDDTAAVVVEPIQGEAGVVIPPPDFLPEARRICTEHGALLWLDEVQTGMGRTGAWLAHSASGVSPDIVTLAKGLAGGIPIGACIATGPSADLLQPGNHGTTFGGNPVAAAAALAVIDTIEKGDLLARAVDVGARLGAGLAERRVTGIRVAGLLIGIDLDADVAAKVVPAAQERGFIVNMCAPNRIRLAPPLILTDEQADLFLSAWPGILDAAYAAGEGARQ
ncbi:MAG TPA: acetylornithine transaminase [Nocardioidaceae bacterium]|nr:acetylornithine transaminase [Nocardioidaceae bacterium]